MSLLFLLMRFVDGESGEDDVIDEERGKLAVSWLNCQRRRSKWREFACGEDMTLAGCCATMTPDDYTQFNLFYLKVNDVCLALSNDVTRHRMEEAVRALHAVTADSVATTRETLAGVRKVRDGLEAAALEAATRHGEVFVKISELGDEAEGHFSRLVAEILRTIEEQRVFGNATKLEFRAMNDAFNASGESVKMVTQEAFGSVRDAQRDLEATLDHIRAKQAESEERHLQLAAEIRLTQEGILVAQREQVANSRALEETSQRVGSVLSIVLRGAEFAGLLFGNFGTLVSSAALYGFMFKLGDLLFSSLSPFLKSASRLICVGGLMVEVSAPHLALFTRFCLVAIPLLGLLGHLFSVAQVVTKAWKTTLPAQQTSSQAGMAYLVPTLIDYIVQLRLTAGTAPMPDLLVYHLSTPPPCYMVSPDEDGDDTLFSKDE